MISSGIRFEVRRLGCAERIAHQLNETRFRVTSSVHSCKGRKAWNLSPGQARADDRILPILTISQGSYRRGLIGIGLTVWQASR